MTAEPPAATGPSGLAVLAGACEVVRLAPEPGRCRGFDQLVACTAEHCAFDACSALCADFVQCVNADSDPCAASVTTCQRSVECMRCSTDAQVCGLAINCSGTLSCAAPTPDGPCAELEACCQTQTVPVACSGWVQGQAALGGDPACEALMQDQEFLNAYASDPPCTFD